MSKNYIIAIFAGLLIVSLLTRGCGNKPQQNTYIQDSLQHAIVLKKDTINTLQLQFDNLNNAFTALQAKKETIKYETKTIWQTKYITDSIIYAYSDSETVKRFLLRYYPN